MVDCDGSSSRDPAGSFPGLGNEINTLGWCLKLQFRHEQDQSCLFHDPELDILLWIDLPPLFIGKLISPTLHSQVETPLTDHHDSTRVRQHQWHLCLVADWGVAVGLDLFLRCEE